MFVKRISLALAVSAVPFATAWGGGHIGAEELVVTAPTGDILQPVDVLEGKELLLLRSSTLGEMLVNQPGVHNNPYGRGAGRPVIRGQSASRIEVLKDGIPTLDVSALSPDHNPTVEPLLVERLEIVRGPATLAYGTAAVGGVVNVFDGRIPSNADAEEFSGAVEVRGDTVAESKAIVGRLDGRSGNIGWHLDASLTDADDYDIAGFATADPAERPANEPDDLQSNSFAESDSYSFGVSWFSDNGYTGISVSDYGTEYGLVGPEATIDGGPFIDLEETRIDVRGEYELDGFFENTRFALGVNDYEHTEFEEVGEPGTLFDNEEWEARVEARHGEVAGVTGAIGLQLNDRDFSAIGDEAFVAPSEAERWGLFVVEDLETDWAQWQFGARLDKADLSNTDYADYDETAFSLAAGFRRPAGDGYELTANLSVSERHPDIEELYSDGLHIATNQVETGLLAQGLPVEKEQATNLDVGIAKVEGPVTWSASLFFADYDDYVYQRIDGQVLEDGELFDNALYTQDDAEFWGGEVEVGVGLVDDGTYTIDLTLFGDFVEAELSDGSDLPRIPPRRIGAELSSARGDWSSNLRATYYAEQDDISSFNTDSFTWVDFDLYYAMPGDDHDWELFFKGTNLLDEEARASTSFVAAFSQLPGRNFAAGARVKF